jgi:hypothetical protein
LVKKALIRAKEIKEDVQDLNVWQHNK